MADLGHQKCFPMNPWEISFPVICIAGPVVDVLQETDLNRLFRISQTATVRCQGSAVSARPHGPCRMVWGLTPNHTHLRAFESVFEYSGERTACSTWSLPVRYMLTRYGPGRPLARRAGGPLAVRIICQAFGAAVEGGQGKFFFNHSKLCEPKAHSRT